MKEQTVIQRSRALRARAAQTDQHTDLIKAQGRCCWEREEFTGINEELENCVLTQADVLSEVAKKVYDFARKLSRDPATGHSWKKKFATEETAREFQREFFEIVHYLRGVSRQ